MYFIEREDFCRLYPTTISILEEYERKAKFIASMIMIPSNIDIMTKSCQELKSPSNKIKWKLFAGCILFNKKDDAMLFKLKMIH